MKRMNVVKSVLCVMLLVSVNVAVVAQSANASNYIGEEQAKSIALRHAGINANDVDYIIVKLDSDRRSTEYDVEFWVGNQEYDYEIDATTGNIVSYDYDAENNYRGMRQAQSRNSADYIGEAQATAIALKHAGISEADANQLRCKFDFDDGFAEYEIEWRVAQTEYEYTISATTGDILEFDVDRNFF